MHSHWATERGYALQTRPNANSRTPPGPQPQFATEQMAVISAPRMSKSFSPRLHRSCQLKRLRRCTTMHSKHSAGFRTIIGNWFHFQPELGKPIEFDADLRPHDRRGRANGQDWSPPFRNCRNKASRLAGSEPPSLGLSARNFQTWPSRAPYRARQASSAGLKRCQPESRL